MLSRRLDFRVRKEGTALVREARAALARKRDLRGKGGSLLEITDEVDTALTRRDLQTVRVRLPVLDALIDELVVRKAKASVASGVESLVLTLLLALTLKGLVLEAFKIPSSSMYPTLEIGDHIFVNKFIYGIRIPWTTTKLVTFTRPQRGDVVVFVQPCEPDRDYIKRIVATEGETVEVRCNVVFVNGQAVPQELVDGNASYADNQNGPWEDKPVSRYRETVNGKAYETFQNALRPAHPPMPSDRTDFPRYAESDPPSCASDGKPAAPNQAIGKIVVTDEHADQCAPQRHFVVPAGHVFAMGDNRENSNDSRFWGPVPVENIKGKAMFMFLSYPDKLWAPQTWRWSRMGNFIE